MNSDQVQAPLSLLLKFLDQLEAVKIHYDLKHVRGSIMVSAYLPQGVWEIEFFEDGNIEVELLKRGEGVDGVSAEWLDRFIEENTD